MRNISLCAIAVAAISIASAASATTTTTFGSRDGGAASFDATVAAAGQTVKVQALVNNQTVYSDFVLNKAPTINYTYNSESISGSTIGVSPAGPNTVPRATPTAYQASGFSITFANGVNSFGFNVGDWGTCCQPSALYISFDGGTPIQVGNSTTVGDVFLTNGEPIVFVGAFDDSSTFNTVSFWGDGVGEYLVAGGTLRYATVAAGSLPAVPEPATWAMMIGGFGMVGGALRNRKSSVSFA